MKNLLTLAALLLALATVALPVLATPTADYTLLTLEMADQAALPADHAASAVDTAGVMPASIDFMSSCTGGATATSYLSLMELHDAWREEVMADAGFRSVSLDASPG